MSPPPRSLTFVVSTSLLTASLSLAGCDEGPVNPGPVEDSQDKTDKGGDEDHVNVGPETPPPEPEPIHVNEGPEPVPPEPTPEPVIKSVNPGPEPVPEPPSVIKSNPGPNNEPPADIEPKRVNTQPEP
jgi:hypothetical protein